MGKSTTANMFRDLNVPVHDADQTVHQLYQNEAVPLLQKQFPDAVINGVVDRNLLGKIVLNDPDQMKILENLIHPMVRQKEQEFSASSKSQGAKLVLLDIPLLYETGGEKRVDYVLVVTASSEEQQRRVLAREGMNEQKLAAILARQVPDDQKRARADFVIDTGQGLQSAQKQVAEIIKTLEQANSN